MSTQTEYIGLHQWESTDPFLREDFNEDNRKIDQKVKAAQERIEQTAGGLENMSYNIYNLLLRDYYEGKYTGFKRGLMFDGFLDESRISTWEGSAYRDTEIHTVSIDTVGQSSVPRPATSTTSITASVGKYVAQSWTAQGCGTITSVSVCGKSIGDASHEAALSIWQDGEKLADGTAPILFEVGDGEWHEFSISCPIRKGETYEFRFECLESGSRFGSIGCLREENDGAFATVALGITVTSGGSISGSITSESAQLGAWRNAVCYVRHNGAGQLAAALSRSDDGWDAMEADQTAPAETLDGTPCMESVFRLERAEPVETAVFRLTLSAQNGQVPICYDYGVIFLE